MAYCAKRGSELNSDGQFCANCEAQVGPEMPEPSGGRSIARSQLALQIGTSIGFFVLMVLIVMLPFTAESGTSYGQHQVLSGYQLLAVEFTFISPPLPAVQLLHVEPDVGKLLYGRSLRLSEPRANTCG